MYWIGGAGPAKEEGEGTDFHATKHQFVTVTPLQVDLTDHERLGYWTQAFAQLHPEAAVAQPNVTNVGASSAIISPT